MLEIFPFGKIIPSQLFKTKTNRIILLIIGLTSLLTSAVIFIYSSLNNNVEQSLKIVIITGFPFIIIGASALSYYADNLLEVQLTSLYKEREEITQKLEKEKELDIFHTIQLSLNQLTEYYTINKNQAKRSFTFSVIAIILGLATILVGVWLKYFGNNTVDIAFLTGAVGILIEFIGGAYFFMYKKSLEQINFFFGQLIKIEDTMLAIKLADGISLEEKKIEMREKIILSLLERSLK